MRRNSERVSPSRTHEEMVAKWMEDPAFKMEYDALEDEHRLLREMLRARKRSGLTQAGIAKRMGTKAPAIARLEASSGFCRHSPSLGTLRKYAWAVGCKLEIRFRPMVFGHTLFA